MTARVISRLLRKNGFEMAHINDETERYEEGFYVHRVGFSNFVSVDFHAHGIIGSKEKRERVKHERARVRAFLADKGYPTDPHTGFVTCERD